MVTTKPFVYTLLLLGLFISGCSEYDKGYMDGCASGFGLGCVVGGFIVLWFFFTIGKSIFGKIFD